MVEVVPAKDDLPAIWEATPDHPQISAYPERRAYQSHILGFGKSPSVVSNLLRQAHCASLRVERRF